MLNASFSHSARLSDLDFVALDFETTGAVPGWPIEPWQVGMVRFRLGDGAGEEFESLLRVGRRPFHHAAPGRHPEMRDEIQRAPTPADILPRCLPWWNGARLVAHNASTEKRILRSLAPLHGASAWLDTLFLVRRFFPDMPSHALEDVIPALGLQKELDAVCPNRAPHDALYDAHACRLLFQYIANLPRLADWTLNDWLALR